MRYVSNLETLGAHPMSFVTTWIDVGSEGDPLPNLCITVTLRGIG